MPNLDAVRAGRCSILLCYIQGKYDDDPTKDELIVVTILVAASSSMSFASINSQASLTRLGAVRSDQVQIENCRDKSNLKAWFIHEVAAAAHSAQASRRRVVPEKQQVRGYDFGESIACLTCRVISRPLFRHWYILWLSFHTPLHHSAGASG